MGAAAEIGSNLLLFALVFGMSATVDIKDLRKQLGNKNALLTGVFLQFVVLPFLGFAVVKALSLSSAMGVTLLVVTSSPGGSYSNWWCSMFNADLALSVTMTAISTLLSIVMLPVNLTIYTTFSYSGSVVKNLDWLSLFISLVVVIGAIGLGLFCSAKIHSHKFNLFANKLGNVAGIALVVYSILVSGSDDDDDGGSGEGNGLWDRGWVFYLGVAAPCVLGLVAANLMTSFFRLKKPERVTTSVECCYQNVGIATSVAISMFEGDELAEAIGVPLFYGLVEAVVLGFYCIGAWKMGWTKAPRDESICVVIVTSYEVEDAQLHDVDAIEVVLGVGKDGLPSDLIFSFDEEQGYHVDEGTLYVISHPPVPEGPRLSLSAVSALSAAKSEESAKEADEGVAPPSGSLDEPSDDVTAASEDGESPSRSSSEGPRKDGYVRVMAASPGTDGINGSRTIPSDGPGRGGYVRVPMASPGTPGDDDVRLVVSDLGTSRSDEPDRDSAPRAASGDAARTDDGRPRDGAASAAPNASSHPVEARRLSAPDASSRPVGAARRLSFDDARMRRSALERIGAAPWGPSGGGGAPPQLSASTGPAGGTTRPAGSLEDAGMQRSASERIGAAPREPSGGGARGGGAASPQLSASTEPARGTTPLAGSFDDAGTHRSASERIGAAPRGPSGGGARGGGAASPQLSASTEPAGGTRTLLVGSFDDAGTYRSEPGRRRRRGEGGGSMTTSLVEHRRCAQRRSLASEEDANPPTEEEDEDGSSSSSRDDFEQEPRDVGEEGSAGRARALSESSAEERPVPAEERRID